MHTRRTLFRSVPFLGTGSTNPTSTNPTSTKAPRTDRFELARKTCEKTILPAVVETKLAESPGRERGDCGCFVHVGPSIAEGGLDGTAVVLEAARRLEPRGYDSMQVGVQTGEGSSAGYHAHKSLGDADLLYAQLDGAPLPDGGVHLVHLRWPTEGEASINNQHPTVIREDQAQPSELELVFNGVLENWGEVDRWLAERGVFRPQNVTTDAWSMSALVHYHFAQPSDAQIEARVAEIERVRGLASGRVKSDPKDAVRAIEELKSEGEHMSLREAVQAASPQLKGDFAFIVISEQEPGRAVATVQGQKPLLVGRGDDRTGNFVASDACAFLKYTDQVQNVSSGDVVEVTKSPAEVKFFRGTEVLADSKRPLVQIDRTEALATKSLTLRDGRTVSFDSFTEKEIHEQSSAIERTLRHDGRVEVLRDRIAGRSTTLPGLVLTDRDWKNARGLTIVGMGTAALAADSALPFLEEDLSLGAKRPFDVEVKVGSTAFDDLRRKIRASLEQHRVVIKPEDWPTHAEGWAELAKKYAKKGGPLENLAKRYKDRIGIAVSQSGNTQDTNQLVILLQAFGMRFIGVVNKPSETPLVRMTKDDGGVFKTKAGAEVGVASTKAFSAQLTAFRIISLYAGLARGSLSPEDASRRLDALEALPDLVDTWLEDETQQARVKCAAAEIAKQKNVLFLGRDTMVPVASEGALKMMELAYVQTKDLDMSLMKHGPIAIFPTAPDPENRQLAVGMFTDAHTVEEARGNLSEIAARYGEVVCVAHERDYEALERHSLAVITVPEVDPHLAPILSVLPLQRLAIETAQVIDATARSIGGSAERIDWAVRTGGDLKTTLETERAAWNERVKTGALNMVQPDKIATIADRFDRAILSATTDAPDAPELANAVAAILRGPRLSLVHLFDQLDAEGVLGQADHARLAKILNTAKSAPEAGAAYEKLQAALPIFLGQLVGRQSGIADHLTAHRKTRGLAQILSRDLDKPRGLAKEVTV